MNAKKLRLGLIGKDVSKSPSGRIHNFILNQKCKETLFGRELTRAAILVGGGLTLNCYTDKPCLQIYTGNFMENEVRNLSEHILSQQRPRL